MRILPRQEITSLQQTEQERKVKEGLKIATEVDTLREMRAAEEQNLAAFREKSLKIVQYQINDLASEKKRLEVEITAREQELQRLLQPMEETFGAFVKKETAFIETEKQRLAEWQTDLSLMAQELKIIKEELTKRDNALKSERIEVARLSEAARKEKNRSREEIAIARNKAQWIISDAEVNMAQAETYETSLRTRALELQILEQQLDERKAELSQRENEVESERLKYYSPVKRI